MVPKGSKRTTRQRWVLFFYRLAGVLFFASLGVIYWFFRGGDIYKLIELDAVWRVRALLKWNPQAVHGDVNKFDTPLTLTAKMGNFDIAKILLEHGANPNAQAEEAYHAYGRPLIGNQGTSLHFCAQRNDSRLTQLLIQHGASVEKSGAKVWITPLLEAVQSGSLDVVKVLLKNGANPNCFAHEWDGDYGIIDQKAVLIAYSKRRKTAYSEIFKELINFEADLENVLVANNYPEFNSCGIVHFSAFYGESKILKIALDHGADPNARSANNTVPLAMAALGRQPAMMELLLDYGADPNACGFLEMTPLLEALSFCQPELPESSEAIALLLRRGADPNVRLSDGTPAVVLAAKRWDAEMLELLEKYGADLSARDNAGRTALEEKRDSVIFNPSAENKLLIFLKMTSGV
jgi:ankyrin